LPCEVYFGLHQLNPSSRKARGGGNPHVHPRNLLGIYLSYYILEWNFFSFLFRLFVGSAWSTFCLGGGRCISTANRLYQYSVASESGQFSLRLENSLKVFIVVTRSQDMKRNSKGIENKHYDKRNPRTNARHANNVTLDPFFTTEV